MHDAASYLINLLVRVSGSGVRRELSTSDQLLSRVKALASDSSKVIVSDATVDRLRAHRIPSAVLFRILSAGAVDGCVEAGSREGDWELKLSAEDDELIGLCLELVVTRNERLFIKTLRQNFTADDHRPGL